MEMKDFFTSDDRTLYETEFRDWLPEKILDAHVHVMTPECMPSGYELPEKNCFRKFGGSFSFEQLRQIVAWMLPGKEYYMNSFGMPNAEADREAGNKYVGKEVDNRRVFGMALAAPGDKTAALRRQIESYRLIGCKPYPNFVTGKPVSEITIFDMLSEEQMEYFDEKGLAVTLHIPRPESLADPVNQRQMVELCRRYPGAQIIFAHIGRAYYLRNVAGGLDGIAECPNAWLDTAMVNHEGVLEYAFTHFPRERILFATDAPICFLRGKSVEVNHRYVYLMGEDFRVGSSIYDSEHVLAFTFFLYEQLRGIKLASERAGLTRGEVENIFFFNAFKLFRGIAQRNFKGHEND